jgi:nitrous oxidase accessory protein
MKGARAMWLPVSVLVTILTVGASCAAERIVPAEPGALARAIEAAAPGDVLVLAAGDHAGPVVIDRALVLKGDGARIVGPKEGTVVSIEADDVTIEGLAITGSGKRLDNLDSGIAIAKGTKRARVIGNRLTGNLIGVDVQGGLDALVKGNLIVGRDDLRRPEMGPGIYVWNAPGLLVEDNDISLGRDGIFVTSSSDAVYRDNRMHDLRFAFHSMYANDIEVVGNRSTGNNLGFAFMYSTRVVARGNLSDGDVTHAFFMNFANRSVLEGNEARNGGEKCLFVYNANKNQIRDNRFEGCGIGLHFTAGSEGNVLSGNAFIDNRTQVKYVGSRWIEWSENGRGNYWSDHVGFDIDGNGRADSPYRPNSAIDQLVWTQPMAKLLLGAPAMQLISFSQSRFPGLLPGGVTDSYPLLSPGNAGVGGATQ